MSAPPLHGLRVADLSRCVAGQFAARLYADQGAEVVLVEPAGGSPTRATGPFDRDGGSLLFRHLSSGKREAGRHPDQVDALVDLAADERWDVVLVSDPEQGRRVRQRWPDASVAVVTDFADSGPYARWTGGELVHQALSGSMYYNGRADAKPLYGTGYRVDYAAGLLLYTQSLAQRLGPADRPVAVVRVNRHEAAVAMEQNFSTQWAYSHTLAARGEWNRPKGRVRCQDGWLAFFASDHNLAELFAALGAPEAYGHPPFESWQGFVRHIAEATRLFNVSAADLTQRVALRSALRDKLVLSPVRRLGDLEHDEQLVARSFWTKDAAGRRTLGPVWDHTAAPVGAPRGRAARRAAARPRWGTEAGLTGPLAGIRVVDLTSAWSGPMATRLLAALGAEVIKVEGPERMDGWRGHKTNPWHPDSYPDSVPGARPYNRNAWFNTQNQGKLSAALDLKHPDGLATARDLVAQSDVVIANFSPGTLARLGLGLEAARAANPSIVVTEMSAYGDDGPLRDHRGLGQTMEAMSGITSLIGYEDEDEPLGSGSAYVDPMGGLAGAAAVVTALVRSRRDGSAERVEVPQRDAAMHWIGEQILHALENGARLGTVGNQHPTAYPHDAYRARGEDEWVAVAAYTDPQWVALCGALGWDDWVDDERFATAALRADAREQVDARLGAAAAARDKYELATLLQEAGVPAAPVQNGPDLFRDPQLRSRDWFTALPHAEVGARDHPGVPVELDGRLSRPRQSAPLFAEHTDWVLAEVLGYADDRIRTLTDAGAVGDPDRAQQDDLEGALR
ncbi:CoA transferase [Microlunatus antarcticus]|uniref:Crotonobetainyl-CoA:carnitine CoA-transferase CaiB-like acyl-CoA transferase n=1 Tax=Microlunatus antarcticus TaxID=53388 RepID=A0A7W5JZF6_9ACTN|nr:CoA transferase [Microlunatus antarcticus]MBB3329145.1 crotonobetainyl-CoA:carnitine CoA-transferase CaiB-like acyl-CoA transferase [Microlunatus antarcticus]